MDENSESKADGLKHSEIREKVLGSPKGANPRPIRKRGFHRALKRGEIWATLEHSQRVLLKSLSDMYTRHALDLADRGNIIQGLAGFLGQKK